MNKNRLINLGVFMIIVVGASLLSTGVKNFVIALMQGQLPILPMPILIGGVLISIFWKYLTAGYRNFAVILGIIILPILGIFYLGKAKWVHKPLDFLGQTETLPDGTKQYHTITEIQLKDHTGKTVTMADFDTCIVVANIFFASCPEICPEMNKQVQTVAEKFYRNNKVRFLSISIDPESDSVPVLKNYAARFRADRLNWQFCTGSKKEIYDWVFKDLLLATEQKRRDFIHDDKVVLIDKEKHVRAILQTRGDKNKDRFQALKRIEEDINNLLYEYRQKELDK